MQMHIGAAKSCSLLALRQSLTGVLCGLRYRQSVELRSQRVIDFDELTDAQKRTLLINLQKKRKALQSQLDEVSRSLKGLDRSIKVVEKKSKRRA